MLLVYYINKIFIIIFFILFLFFLKQSFNYFKLIPATIACPKDTEPSPGHELMC